MNSAQAKQLSLPDLMKRLGYQPTRITKGGNEYWYQSPFRTEKDASFHTSFLGGKWIWNDFGDIGGTVIDFVMRHENHQSVSDALRFLNGMYSKNDFKTHRATNFEKTSTTNIKTKTFLKDKVKPLEHPALIQYLTEKRRIDLSIGKNYLKEVHFSNVENDKKYFALGMENESGGYEVRNPFFKSSIGKKDLCIFRGKGGGEVSIFEGYMDFLSFLTDYKKPHLEGDAIILNSVAFAEKAKNVIQKKSYQKIYTFLDNDNTGRETLSLFKQLNLPLVSLNHIYEGFKDYNEYLQNKNSLTLL